MHGEPGFGGQGPAGRRLERGATGVPSGGHGGGADPDHGGDGSGRRSDSTHDSSVLADRASDQWETAAG
ncbi:hypothetical protein GCM10010320_40000 [Streptomyces caelestis]|nr:hypothetical protein GCM10010320_40000 [Streptomyces caelestis]